MTLMAVGGGVLLEQPMTQRKVGSAARLIKVIFSHILISTSSIPRVKIELHNISDYCNRYNYLFCAYTA